MISKKFLLDSINADGRIIFPIALLEMYAFNNNSFTFNLNVVAFKIIEKDSIYFINVSLSEKEFKNIKKSVEKK
ncbi:MAG: hypothetical protein E7Z85_07195 [Methanosphaera stadtmanae]|nr:hypothetical protein [Methanosphaera stadtmanae]